MSLSLPHNLLKNNKCQNDLTRSTFNFKKNSTPLITPLQTFNTLNEKQINNVLNHSITKEQLRLLVNISTNAQLLFQPIILAIQDVYSLTNQSFTVHQVVWVLQNGKFYRFLNKSNEILINLNDKSIESQKNCLIASILCFFTQTLKLSEIQKILKILHMEECYYSSSPYGIPLDLSKILKILKKIDRIIRSIDFKAWFNDFKTLIKSQFIDSYQFLYLITMTESKINHTSQSYFNLNSNKIKLNLQKQKSTNKKVFKELSQENRRSISQANFRFRVQGLKTSIFFSKKQSLQKKQNSYILIKRKLSQVQLKLLNQRKKSWSLSQKQKLNKMLQQNQQNQSRSKSNNHNHNHNNKTRQTLSLSLSQTINSTKNKNTKLSDYEKYCQSTQKQFNRILDSQLKKVNELIMNDRDNRDNRDNRYNNLKSKLKLNQKQKRKLKLK